jgi:peptidoglycan/LPS O-acetylase OafA/YrhL
MYLLPFLLVVLELSRFGGTERLERRDMRMALILVLAVLFLSFGDPTSGARQPGLHLVAACAVLLLLVGSGIRSELLERIADYSFTIFLFHTFSAPRRGCCYRMRVCRRSR